MAVTSIFIASLLGSLHCAAMCGGFSLYCAGQSKSPLVAQLAYNIGRLVSYACLGLLAGWGGSSLESVAEPAGIQKAAALLAGTALIIWGLMSLFWPARFGASAVPSRLTLTSRKLFGGALSSAKQGRGTFHAALIGLLTFLLPCGWLYMFVGVAAATAHPLEGMLVMSTFWLGTVPALATFGGMSKVLVSRLGKRLPKVTASLVILAGIFSLSGHIWPSALGMGGMHEHHHHQIEETNQAVDDLTKPREHHHH